MPSRQKFTHAFHVPGTLSADLNIRWTAPSNCTLVHVSAVASNDSDATLKIGTSSDDDEFKTAAVIGDSGVPVEWDYDDFVTYANKAYPRIEDGDVLVLTLDHDGATGTAAADFTVVLTFLEG